jgi:hypothetical protein
MMAESVVPQLVVDNSMAGSPKSVKVLFLKVKLLLDTELEYDFDINSLGFVIRSRSDIKL